MNAISEVLSGLRKDSNLSARAVAYSIDISKTSILLAETGQLDPRLSTFCKIAEAYNIKPSDLLSMVENKLPETWSFCD